jgi:transposase
VRNASVWRGLLGVERTVVEQVEFDTETDTLVAHVRPRGGVWQRCGRCGRRGSWYDQGDGRRRWRALDLGVVQTWLEGDAPRVQCPVHGPTVVGVPWARHGAGHTYAFDDQVAWLAVRTSKTSVEALMRIAWRTVGAIVARVAADAQAGVDRWANLRRIGIDEISYKKGHKYVTIVVDHDTGYLIWAAPGRNRKTLRRFFTALGEARCEQITQVSADGADWIADVVALCCPNAVRGADPFHVVSWATEALDQVRRDAWNAARGGKGGATEESKALKRARWALWKKPEDLTEAQQAKLGWIARTHPRVHRAWALKEGLRMVFTLARRGAKTAAKDALDRWLSWARRCRLPAFVDLARRVTAHRQAIHVSIDYDLSNGLIESVNTKLRLLTRMAFGYSDPHALIGLGILALGGLCPPLPGRTNRALTRR